jgi:hypothetical protein
MNLLLRNNKGEPALIGFPLAYSHDRRLLVHTKHIA